MPYPIQSFIFNSETKFQTTKSLTFVYNLPTYYQIGQMFPALTTLKLMLYSVTNRTSLAGLFPNSLEELHICVQSGVEELYLDQSIDMPNLQVFGIADTGGDIMQHMGLTALKTLILYQTYNAPQETTQQIIRPSYPANNRSQLQVSRLELHDWDDRVGGPSGNGTRAILRKWVPYMPGLKSISIEGRVINGEELVDVITGLAPRKFEVTLAYTSGITAEQCDRLKPLTSQLHIYV
jgi:hypothetical protein